MDRKTMLDFWIDARMEEICLLSEYDLNYLTQKMDESKPFARIMDYIENLKIPSKTKKELSDMVFEMEGSISSEFEYFNIKYYKHGFSDAVNLIYDAKEYKKTGEK